MYGINVTISLNGTPAYKVADDFETRLGYAPCAAYPYSTRTLKYNFGLDADVRRIINACIAVSARHDVFISMTENTFAHHRSRSMYKGVLNNNPFCKTA